MPDRVVVCFGCGRSHSFVDVVPRSAVCESCGLDLRCCRTCRFYEPRAYNECSEPSAERVLEKERANFCDFYAVAAAAGAGGGQAGSGALAELERLFGKN
jgi:hypothetical protein